MDYALPPLKTDGLRYGSWGKAMKTLEEWQKDLKPAEAKLLACCKSGNIALIEKERPTEKTEANEIRSSFIRWLILTQEVEIDPLGIQVRGAWISGMLDLENVVCEKILYFGKCYFDEKIYLMRALTKTIYLHGSFCQKGIIGDGLVCHGSLHLRHSFESHDEVRFLGAKVEGNFDCSQATFKALNEKQRALNCDGMNVVGNLFMREECKVLQGIINLTSATVGSLSDDKDFWEQETLKHVELNGFRYGHIYGDTSASFRLEKMLGKMPRDEFTPQPYKQLAKVLRTMGHKNDADEVMIALHEKKMEISKSESLSYLLQKIYKWTSLYGYRPLRLIYIILIFWGAFGSIYWYAASVAVFAPSNPLIFQKDYNCTINQKGTPWNTLPKDYNASNNWYYATPPEYSTFQPFWYSLDLLLPTLDLQLEKDWGVVIPSPKGNWTDGSAFLTTNDNNEIVFIINYLIRFFVWIEILIGWLLGIGLVAFVSGQLRIVED